MYSCSRRVKMRLWESNFDASVGAVAKPPVTYLSQR